MWLLKQLSGRPRRGTAVIEVAMVLPLMLLLTLGLIEYGWLLLKAQQINSAARNAVRVLATADGTYASAEAKATEIMAAARITGYTVIPQEPSGVQPGDTVSVTVSVPVAGNPKMDLLGITRIGDWSFGLPSVLQATMSMAKEGPR